MVQGVSTAFDKLTPREREILRLIAAHLQSKEIARELNLSPKTVEMHVLSARRRLSGLSRRDAALAFVAWENDDPGNDYRRQSSDLVALPDLPPSERKAGGDQNSTARILPRDWRHELSNIQWIGVILAITALTAVLLAITAIGIHEFIMAIQAISGR